jgi:hypothetical protein
MKILNGNIMSTCKSFYELKKHRKYRAVLLGSVYEGTMVKLYPNPDVIKMRNVTLFGVPNKKSEFSFFSKDFEFYDVQEIRDNAMKAKRSMEQRSLLIILKRLINDDFHW